MTTVADEIDPVALGATLYLPGTRTDLNEILLDRRLPGLRSAVVCLEDAIRPDQIPLALQRLAGLLGALRDATREAAGPAIFIRPRDQRMLAHILTFRGIERAAGFVLPKVTADTLPGWLAALSFDHHLLMPTLETREVFDAAEMRRLREQLLAVRDRVLAIRIGGNDLLQQLGARRSAVRTAYDGPLGPVVAGLIGIFAPWGFAMSAPVFENFANMALLREEVERDVEYGLLTKTAIHPAQIPVIQDGYRVTVAELDSARAILDDSSNAVFAVGGAMCEPATHRRWASAIVRRAGCFGVVQDAGGLALIG